MAHEPTFPDFKHLTVNDKDTYTSLVSQYPPYSDFLFSTLHIWWNLNDQLLISTLKNNLLINYELPFDADSSGIGLIGTNQVDESINTVFEHLRTLSKPLKLVHIPEFTIDAISQKEIFTISEELDYGEYVLDARAFLGLKGKSYAALRYHLNRFSRTVEGMDMEIKSLDLTINSSKSQIMDALVRWEEVHPPRNDQEKTEHLAIRKSLDNANALDLDNICMYLNGKLYGIAIFDKSYDGTYYILHHMRVDYSIDYISDYMHKILAEKAMDDGVSYINIEMDLGNESLKEHKLSLRPTSFLKKYTIRPLKN